MWQSQPAVFTGLAMADVPGPRKTRVSALRSCPTNIPSSGNVYTKSRCIPAVPNASSCRIIEDCIALTTMPKTGQTLPMECHRILVLPCSCIREIPTACISFQLSPMSFAAHARAGFEFIGPATVAPLGSLLCAACHKSVLTKLSCVMLSVRTHSTHSEFISVHGAGSSLARAMKEEHGKRYSKDCRQWSAYGVQSSRTPLAV